MSLYRKAYGALVAVWEAMVTTWYLLLIAALAVAVLFLAGFVISMGVELADRMVTP
jgi:hypothetical protein